MKELLAQVAQAKAFESSRVMLFRFAVQPSIRTMAVGTGRQGLIIDYAMPKCPSRQLSCVYEG